MPFKTENEYQKEINRGFYEKCPKAVLAAIAVSLLYQINGEDMNATTALRKEWAILNENGIIPQKTPLTD